MDAKYKPLSNLLTKAAKTAFMAAGAALFQYASTHTDAIVSVVPAKWAGIVSILLSSILLYHKQPPTAAS